MENTKNAIFFNFSYYALKLLGKGMYSNPWTAIAELVANGLDAQATEVKILIDMSDKQHSVIEIIDNGSGMDYHDLSDKYALIGRDKREDTDISDEMKKDLMGRKGVGKLAALYLSNKYYIVSKTAREVPSAWCLDATDVKDSDIPRLDRYEMHEVNLECEKEWTRYRTGTVIQLTNVDLTNFGLKTIDGLKARLADFYLVDALSGKIEVCVIERNGQKKLFYPIEKSIAYKNFYAFFDNTGLKYSERLSKDVYISAPVEKIGAKRRDIIILDSNAFLLAGKKRFHKENGELTENEIDYRLVGWIGIHTSIKKEDAVKNDPEYLRNKAYRPNQLRLYVRKKLAVENFLDYIQNTQAFSNYIEGEISFDILDNNELGDIATSNRQGFVEDDERVLLLIELVKPIINNLIRARNQIGSQINREVEAYYEEEKLREEAKRIEAEKERERANEKREQAEEEKKKAESERNIAISERDEQKSRADQLSVDLGSEKKRTYFLMDSLDENHIDFAKRLHMLKINASTLQKTVTKTVLKMQRGKFSNDDIWELLKKLSYLTSRIQAYLSYGGLANFNTESEYVDGDLFGFIAEYSDEILVRNEEISINIELKDNEEWNMRFIPQDIVIILENILSNSVKNHATKLTIQMKKECDKAVILFNDNGDGLSPSIKNPDELFDFGKGYTKVGTGVGLYHIKEIVTSELHGEVEINSGYTQGFQLEIRLGGKDEV